MTIKNREVQPSPIAQNEFPALCVDPIERVGGVGVEDTPVETVLEVVVGAQKKTVFVLVTIWVPSD